MAMETNELIDVHELTPFKKFIMSIGAIPTSYLEAMSYAELVMWFCNYLQNTVIPTVNNNAEAVEELQQVVIDFENAITQDFNNLESYVDNYFENNFPALVKSTLDDMAEDGTLENLLNDAAHLTKSYDTYTDMIADSEHFTNGLRLKTLGYYSVNDGGDAEYFVNNSVIATNYQIDLENGLYLNLITNNNVINVRQFGAKGDGITNDSTAFINAINIGNEIFIPNGTYLLSNKIEITKNIHLYGTGKDSILKTNIDGAVIEVTQNEGEHVDAIIEDIAIDNNFADRTTPAVYFHDFLSLTVNNLFYDNSAGGKNEVYVKDVITSTFEKCIFNHSSLKLKTWDVKINKSWFWSLSQDYGIFIVGGSGNINIIDTDVVPPFQSNDNYISHSNMLTYWSTARLQAGIVIGDGTPVLNVKMLGVYIDGGSMETGRGIIVNQDCHNILLNNWSANFTDDDLVTIDSSYGVTVSNGQITDCYGLDCSLIQVIKTATQGCSQMTISNNTILLKDASQIPSRKLRSLIEAVDSYRGTIEYNKAYFPGTTRFCENTIHVTYNSDYMLYTNRMAGAEFYADKTGTIEAGQTGVSVNYATWGFPYQPSMANVQIVMDKIVDFRYQFVNNNQIYIALKEALAYDVNFDVIVKL